jgi:hypothetical protein
MRGLICMEAIGRNRVRRVVVIPYGSEGVSASMPGRAVSPAWAASARGPRACSGHGCARAVRGWASWVGPRCGNKFSISLRKSK